MDTNQGDGDTNQGAKEFDPSLLDKDPATLTPDEIKLVQANSKSQFGQKNQWKEKAIDPKTGKPYKELFEAAQSSQNNPTPPAEQAPETEGRIKRLELSEEKRQFGHAHNLTPEETDHVFSFAQGANLKPKEALEHTFVKSGLDAIRQTARADGATPGPSSRSPIVEGKTFGEMTNEEQAKNFPKVVDSLQKRKR